MFQQDHCRPDIQLSGGLNESPLRSLDIVLPHLRTGGIESSIVSILPHLADHGIAVRLILGRRDGALVDRVPLDVPIIDLGGRKASASLRALSHHLSGRDAVLSGTNARNIAVLAAVRLLPTRKRPAVIVSEHTSAADYLSTAKMPVLRRWLMRRLYPDAARLAVPLLSLGQGWTAALDGRAPPVCELPNAIFGADRQTGAGVGPVRDTDLVVSMGRLHPAKGHDRVIEAFAKARQMRPALKLEIWGEGAERAHLQGMIARRDLDSCARLCGLTDDPLHTLARAGALAMGSRREGFGNVAVEALSVGTPVVATACSGPVAILSLAQGAGHIVPNHDDTVDLARAIAQTTGRAAMMQDALNAAPILRARYGADSAAMALGQLIHDVLRDKTAE